MGKFSISEYGQCYLGQYKVQRKAVNEWLGKGHYVKS